MKTFEVTIQGTTPLLQHRFGETAEADVKKTTRRISIQDSKTPREHAEMVSYRLPNGNCWMPGAAFAKLMTEAAGGHKIRGSRKSAKYIVPAAVLVLDDAITLMNEGVPLKTFEVDSRPVVIPATKGRVMRHRPRFEQWGATFRIRINEELLSPDFVHQLLVEGGQQIGVGDFRPEKRGPYGTFMVTSWKE